VLARRIIDDLLEFCFPGSCAACKNPCEGSAALCEPCMAELERLSSAPACDDCGAPLALPDTPCAYCKGRGIAYFDRIVRLGIYEEPIRTLILQLKYHNKWTIGEHLADWLLQQERVKGLLTQTQCLAPVPLHRWRQFRRGYNQAEILARRLSKKCRIPLVHPARRAMNTETQTHLHSRAKRMQNLRGAFDLKNPDSIQGRHVVVIDDVMTTGATLLTFARTLRKAKPASLCAIVVAVADPAGRGFEVA
jgi:ComF family protein